MSKEYQILQLRTQGHSQRRIAEMLKVSRNTVANVYKALETNPITEAELSTMNHQELHLKLFPGSEHLPTLVMPDHEYIHKELLKSGVTLKLLWEEYVGDCRKSGKPPYMYSQYCKLYQDYVDKHRLTMHIRHKPGDKLMVDWMGTTMPLYDRLTGKNCKVYLFVATLPFSMCCFAKACLTMKEEDWINVHIDMYEYFGSSTRLIIPDNLKVGIISNKKLEDPIANRTYQELADHYHSALLPARVLAPKDKAAVEGSVGNLTTHIVARLRNRRFFSINEMNAAIIKELNIYNRNEFQKKDGSRYSVYITEEKPFMQPLPQYPYEFAKWKVAKVQLNYHVAIDYQNYSVPYEYVKKEVDIRYTKSMIEVFFKGVRICSHKRLYGRRGQYDTAIDHMPANHQFYSQWDSKRFLKWASSIGESTKAVVQKLFESYRVEEQAYKGCLSLLKLADKYSPERLNAACRIALMNMTSPRYKNIRLILEAGQDKTVSGTLSRTIVWQNDSNKHGIVRGAAYFGGGHNEE
jgi:transposase